MDAKKQISRVQSVQPMSSAAYPAAPESESVLEYLGGVSVAANERILAEIRTRLKERPGEEIRLFVTSPGGPSGAAMSFYDMVKRIMRVPLTTIGSGDVDSSGIIIFLSGSRRFITPHTTLLLHLASRSFDPRQRFTASELSAMAREDRMKDLQYASIVAENSNSLTPKAVFKLMSENTVLSPEELVAYGLADAILE